MVANDVFPCDSNLPLEGIELHNKIFLLQLLDIDGGPSANNKKTRLLSKYSRKYPDRFGVPKSIRYARTKWLLDRWKRNGMESFQQTKASIFALSVDPPPCTQSCSFPLQEEVPSAPKPEPSKTRRRLEKPKPTKLEPKSPPIIKKTTRSSATMVKFGSPLRFVRGLTENKGECGIVVFAFLLLVMPTVLSHLNSFSRSRSY